MRLKVLVVFFQLATMAKSLLFCCFSPPVAPNIAAVVDLLFLYGLLLFVVTSKRVPVPG